MEDEGAVKELVVKCFAFSSGTTAVSSEVLPDLRYSLDGTIRPRKYAMRTTILFPWTMSFQAVKHVLEIRSRAAGIQDSTLTFD